jgi:hypothetical protein
VAYPTTEDILTTALQLLGIMGAGESSPAAEHTALALKMFNQLVGQWNTRKRLAFCQRTQSFAFTTAKQSYTIGATANAPDFIVSSGERPARIESANLVMTNGANDVLVPCTVILVDQYDEIAIPSLASSYPQVIYYQPSWPNGTIYPYPAFPTETSFELSLTWWQQLLAVALADIGSAISAPFGYDRAFSLSLAIALYPMFPKRSDIEELKRQERMAIADISSLNVQPPKIGTTDGVQGDGVGLFNYLSRTFQ